MANDIYLQSCNHPEFEFNFLTNILGKFEVDQITGIASIFKFAMAWPVATTLKPAQNDVI